MGVRYRVMDLPIQGMGAFIPLPGINPVASSYGLVKITAMLGTHPIPVPSPTKVWAPTPNNAPQVQSSNVSPDMVLPSKYIAHADNMGPARDAGIGMSLRRLCPLPVPAVSWRAAAKPVMYAPRLGGRVSMAWPRAFQRWPTSSGG